MIDLTSHLIRLQGQSWSKDDIHHVLRNIQTHTDFEVDWDAESGENWINVGSSAAGRIAIISAIIPLAIGVGEPKFWNSLMRLGEYIGVPCFNAPIFCCNTDILIRILEWPENYEIISAAHFSAEDLYYVTI